MKNKIYISIFICFFSIFSINAQSNYYYYYKGQKIYLTLDKSNITLNTLEDFQKSSVSTLNLKDFNIQAENTTGQIKKYASVEFQSMPTDIEYFQKIGALNDNPKIIKAQPNFRTTQNVKIGMSNYFYVTLKNASDLTLLQSIASQKNVQVLNEIPYLPLCYTLICTKNTIGSTLDIANYFFETNNFKYAIPDFLANDVLSNDPLFINQWGFNNTGQYGGTSGIDIKINNAWTISQGNGIKLAVLDQGIDKFHTDLISNLSPLSYDSESLTSPSQILGNHGTACAGIIGATKDNSIGVAGVSPLAKLMDVSNSLASTPNSRIKRGAGINWAVANGADIISNSWGSAVAYDEITNAIDNALINGRNGKGTLVVFASGNNNGAVSYPANTNDNIICVGAMSNCGQRKNPSSCDGETWWGSNFGTKLDIVAPGVLINTTDRSGSAGYTNNDYTPNFNGTSSACPAVAGVCALILSANPCLTGQQVRDIIEQTFQKVGGYSYTATAGRPNGTWNDQMGYGLVDAYAAVQMAQSMGSATLDLMVKDGTDDIGNEPNNITPYMWASTDIWVRNQPDGIDSHQNPEFSPTVPNYAYVRVTNKSCVTSSGNEQLKFYWAKAGTSLEWPDTWDGNHFFPAPNDTKKLGAPVGTVTIPVLQAGQEIILQIPFMVPNPADYSFAGSDQWHFCLLARIEAINDPSNETNGLYANVQNNNNIAWKNVTIVDLLANRTNGVIAVGNPFDEPRTFFLELVKEDLETGKPIYDEAEVTLKMDETLFNAWERGGKIAQQIEGTLEEEKKIVKGNNVIIDNIAFNGNEMGILNINFNFLTQELTEKTRFAYHVIQKDAVTGQIIGGETYIIKKDSRDIFIADAGGDKEVDKNEPITISASQISEPAIYNWYDTNGNLVFTGKDLTIATQVATKYKLEVIATADGFKDYSEVEVNLKPSVLNTIAPNPATNNVTIGYKLNETGSAYLMIIGGYGTTGTSNNYILDTNNTETNINISNYPNGFYTVALVCNGQIVDAKTLIKQ